MIVFISIYSRHKNVNKKKVLIVAAIAKLKTWKLTRLNSVSSSWVLDSSTKLEHLRTCEREAAA